MHFWSFLVDAFVQSSVHRQAHERRRRGVIYNSCSSHDSRLRRSSPRTMVEWVLCYDSIWYSCWFWLWVYRCKYQRPAVAHGIPLTVPLALLCFQLPNELGRPKASRQPSSSSCPPLCSGSPVPPHHLPAEFTSPQTSLPVEALASSPPTPAVGSSSSTDSSQLLTGHTSTTSTSLHTRGGPWYGALCAHCCSFLTYCSSTLRYRWSVLSPPHWACLVSPSESPFLRNCLDVFSSVPFVLLTVVCLAPYAAVLMSVSSFGSAFLLQLGYAKEQTDGSLWMGGVAASAGFLGTLVGGVWSDWDAVKRGRWTTKGGSEGGVRGGLWWRWCGWRGREEEERLCDEDGGEPVGGMGRGGDRMEAVMIRYWEACRFSRKGIEAWSVRDYEVVDTSIVATATCSTTYDSVDAVEGLKSVSSSSGGGMRRNNGDDGEAYVSNGREVCGVVSLEDLLDEDKAGECNDVMTLRSCAVPIRAGLSVYPSPVP
eukprot:GHVQ01043016.1.p1 GENE.GHVQ01043016.1~~GHVQ01043016.1.p1  ORF type:complete len:482 (+),score=89.42 GHVQ01043016.1:477-1922(+)